MKNKCVGRSLLLVAIVLVPMIFILTACKNKNRETTSVIKEGQSDLEYVLSKGTLVVGITDYEPMDYKDGEKWIGFDAELAQGFADSLGVTLEFKEINWDNKTKLLEKGSIDCIWNGMTITDELINSISCSKPYLSNAQVIVLKKSDVSKNQTADDCQHMLFAVEAGSTAESLLKELKFRYTVCSTQHEAIKSVSDKKADAAVIDIIMASSYIGENLQYDNLGYSIFLNDEKMCVGFRKGSDMTDKVNKFLKDAYENGDIYSLAEKYNIKDAILQYEDN